MINVTKTFLPPFEEYTSILKRAWDNVWITNNGELVKELENRLKEYLGVKHLFFCNNGTIVLQMALKALNVTGEVITTPFSYVATTNAILWENCTPIFVDINPATFCLDASKIEEAISEKTQAILATHVYGYPCEVEAIEKIADKYNLKVIYDAAHAFGTKYKNESLFSYGDISTCSFHATKLFHSGEGGCVITNNDDIAQKLLLYRQFGHIGDDYLSIGINGKNSVFHAAMGLCNLNYIDSIRQKRKEQWLYYAYLFREGIYQILDVKENSGYNYSYFPIIFDTEERLLKTMAELNKREIMPRRYFFPSLNKLPYLQYHPCPVSESVAERVLCLPLFDDLTKENQNKIVEVVFETKTK